MEEETNKKESKQFRFTVSQGQGDAYMPSLILAELFRKKLNKNLKKGDKRQKLNSLKNMN